MLLEQADLVRLNPRDGRSMRAQLVAPAHSAERIRHG
jgi:hypothetical protein